MTFPTVQTRQTGFNSTLATSHPITLPSGVTAGDLLIVGVTLGGGATPATSSSGWSSTAANRTTTPVSKIFYKIATGSDALTVTTGAVSCRCAYVGYRISAASGTIYTAASNSATGAGDPPSLTPAGGAQDYLWLAFNFNGTNSASTSPPTNYSSLQTGVPSGSVAASAAERLLNASTEDPGTFSGGVTGSASGDWTIAVAPVAAGGAQKDLALSASFTFASTVALVRQAKFATSTSFAFFSAGALTATRSYAVSASITFGSAVALSRGRSIAASASMAFSATSALKRQRRMAASSAMSLASTAALTRTCKIAANASITFGSTSGMVTTRGMAIVGTITFDAQAALVTGQSAISIDFYPRKRRTRRL